VQLSISDSQNSHRKIKMKKTLVAMAVLAASGAAIAQVTITGEVTVGYDATTNGNGATKSGLGVDTTVINFNATEDLGGGAKISATLGFDGVNRGGVNGGDTKLVYTNKSFGQKWVPPPSAGMASCSRWKPAMTLSPTRHPSVP
jgi:opacity protein-like surface antigen